MTSPLRFLQSKVRFRPIVALYFVAALLSVISTAKADTVSLNFLGASGGNPTLVVSDPGAGYINATAVIDPYTAMVGGTKSLVWCVDPDHEVTPGQSWSAYRTQFGPGADLGKTYLGSAGANTYGEMAWLITQLSKATSTMSKQEIQSAIWSLGDPGDFSASAPAGDTNFVSDVNTLEANAAINALTSGFEILTDTRGKAQEFVVLTPEPATILLLGVGMLGLFSLNRRKFVRRQGSMH